MSTRGALQVAAVSVVAAGVILSPSPRLYAAPVGQGERDRNIVVQITSPSAAAPDRPAQQAPPEVTPAPTPVDASGQGGTVLLQDDFSNPRSGWPTRTSPCCGSSGYEDGVYRARQREGASGTALVP